jgi:alkylation response protein AidB-like acyl-CoA dehydrogenase
VHVPRSNLLHKEGRGLNVALSCLNYGRCTLSAGMLGGARRCMDQAIKWSQTRYQFGRPLSDFELVKAQIAHMASLCYAMDAVLYMTTGMLDRGDEDIMLETAICKVFCSDMGWRAVNDAMQILGGESYMTENEVERVFRDSRINLIVEGANEVMQSFIFAYGGKQLAEKMLSIQDAVGWDPDQGPAGNLARIFRSMSKSAVRRAALPLAVELFLGIRRKAPALTIVHQSLRPEADRFARMVREHSHQFKQASKRYRDAIVNRQAVQARVADTAIWLHAWACTLSKLDQDIRQGREGAEFERDRAAAIHFFDLCETEIHDNFRHLYDNADESMLSAAAAALKHNDTLPNELFSIPERSPVAAGTGRPLRQEGIKQFPGDSTSREQKIAAT